MIKKTLIFIITVSVVLLMWSCPTGDSLYFPSYAPPYEQFEIEQGVALRNDHVCIMINKNRPGSYMGLTGGLSGSVPGGSVDFSGNLMEVLFGFEKAATIPQTGWSAESKYAYKLSVIGTFNNKQVWGVKIDRSNFSAVDQSDDLLYFSWKFLWGESWLDMTGGVNPFYNTNDFNNGCGRLARYPNPTGPLSTFTGDNPSYTTSDYVTSGAINGLGSY